MSAQPYVYQEFNLTNALQMPQVRDRLEKGVKLHELAKLKTMFQACAEKDYIRKMYGTMLQDLEFLQTSGAMQLPETKFGHHISSRRHWVAVSGFFRADRRSLYEENLQARKIVNTLSLYVPVLILDDQAWMIYQTLFRLSHFQPHITFRYLLYVLNVLDSTELPFGNFVNDDFVKWALWTKDPDELLPFLKNAKTQQQVEQGLLETMPQVTKDDPEGLLNQLLIGNYCLPMLRHWVCYDGWYFQPAVPTWAFREDNVGNYLTSWNFFVCEESVA